jgi:hypothetical protein
MLKCGARLGNSIGCIHAESNASTSNVAMQGSNDRDVGWAQAATAPRGGEKLCCELFQALFDMFRVWIASNAEVGACSLENDSLCVAVLLGERECRRKITAKFAAKGIEMGLVVELENCNASPCDAESNALAFIISWWWHCSLPNRFECAGGIDMFCRTLLNVEGKERTTAVAKATVASSAALIAAYKQCNSG